jgi:hypothetical protein
MRYQFDRQTNIMQYVVWNEVQKNSANVLQSKAQEESQNKISNEQTSIPLKCYVLCCGAECNGETHGEVDFEFLLQSSRISGLTVEQLGKY